MTRTGRKAAIITGGSQGTGASLAVTSSLAKPCLASELARALSPP